jgi:ABC-type multidrug transport system fused ATPase/permease subunit
MEPSIVDLTCNIQPGMKVGIVGRTGAGKSSILNALFRLTEIEKDGNIKIDNTDCRELGLHLLRKRIAYIPQSPFLIQGSIRENLDPFDEFKDEDIEKVLQEVRLMDHIN